MQLYDNLARIHTLTECFVVHRLRGLQQAAAVQVPLRVQRLQVFNTWYPEWGVPAETLCLVYCELYELQHHAAGSEQG